MYTVYHTRRSLSTVAPQPSGSIFRKVCLTVRFSFFIRDVAAPLPGISARERAPRAAAAKEKSFPATHGETFSCNGLQNVILS